MAKTSEHLFPISEEPSQPRVQPFQPLLFLSRATGLLPFTTDFNRSSWAKAATGILTVLYSLKCAGEALKLYSSYEAYEIFGMVMIMRSFCDTIVPATHILSLWLYADKYDELGRYIQSITTAKKYHLRIPRVDTSIGLGVIFLDGLLIYSLDQGLAKLNWHAFHKSTSLLSFLVVMQFCSFLEILTHHYKESIKQINTGSLEGRARNQIKLMETTTTVNDIYSLQNLLILIKVSIDIVFYGYLTALTYKVKDPDVYAQFSRAVRFPLNILHNIYILVILTGCCRNVTLEVDRFNEELFKTIRKSNFLCNNNKLRLYAEMRPSVRFTACGFFTIGYPLVTSVAAAATTYLVIIIQFSIPNS